MQFINRQVYGSVYLALFPGLAVVSFTLAIGAPFLAESPATKLIIAGGTTYIAGVVLVTVVFNMPMNKCLEAMDPTIEFAAAYWTQFVSTWARWNHMRTVTTATTTGLLLVGLALLVTV